MGSPVNIVGSHSQNFIMNSDFLWDQRGLPAATVSLDGTHYSCDRWIYRFEAGAGTMTFRSRKNNGNPTGNLKTFYVLTCESTAGSATGVLQNCARQVIEKSLARQLLTFANGKFSIGFWYVSTQTGTHAVSCAYGGNAFTGPTANQTVTFNYPVASTWQYVTATFDMPVTGNGSALETDAGLLVNIGPRTGGSGITTWANGQNFQIAQVQMNPGETPATWRRMYASEAEELLACMRYYELGWMSGMSDGSNAAVWAAVYRFAVPKRAIPLMTFGTQSHFNGGYSIAGNLITSTPTDVYGGTAARNPSGAPQIADQTHGQFFANAEY